MVRRRRRLRFVYAFFGVLALLVGAWGALELDVRRMERAVWDRGDFAGLEKREKMLKWLAGHRLTPSHLRGRVHGLLGDLDYKRKDWEFSFHHYTDSLKPYAEFLDGEKVDPMLFFEQARLLDSDFSKGMQDYQTAAFVAPEIDDREMALDLPPVADSENARFAFEEIEPLSADESEQLQDYFRYATEGKRFNEIRELCDANREKIDALCDLKKKFALADGEDVTALTPLADFFRLLIIDAVAQSASGNKQQAFRSFEASYRLLGYLPQCPDLMTGLIDVSLRERNLAIMNSPAGRLLRNAFAERHLMIENAYAHYITGAYHSSVKLVKGSITEDTPVAKRLRHQVLTYQLEYWSAVRDSNEFVSSSTARNNFFAVQAGWYHKYRPYIYRRNSASYSEGREFAAAIEILAAETVHCMSVPNIGSFEDSLEDVRQKELAILNTPESAEEDLSSQ